MEFDVDSEIVEGADVLVSWLPSREPTSMPLEFTVDDSPARTSGDGKAKQTAQFADQVLITNTEFSNIIEHDDTGLEIDGDAPPDHSINLPTQEASCHT